METAKTVHDLIKEKKLTREELELCKDLIQETKDHEEKIAEYSQQNRQNLKRLSEVMKIISGQTAIGYKPPAPEAIPTSNQSFNGETNFRSGTIDGGRPRQYKDNI